MEKKGVSFSAILVKAQTVVSGGWRISLDISEDDSKQIMDLVQLKEHLLSVGIIAVEAKPVYHEEGVN